MMITIQHTISIPLDNNANLILVRGEHVQVEPRVGVEGRTAKRHRLLNRWGRPIAFITEKQFRLISGKAYNALATK